MKATAEGCRKRGEGGAVKEWKRYKEMQFCGKKEDMKQNEVKRFGSSLEERDRKRGGGEGGVSTILGFRPAWPDFEKRILIASVGWR